MPVKKDSLDDYPFPVYGTQGGGIVKQVGTGYVFIEAPAEECLDLSVGDTMPDEWGVAPANQLAEKMVSGLEAFG